MIKHILIVKTSSMGDIIHTLPALTDAVKHNPLIQFDWVVEKAFEEIPAWHTGVNQVIPMQFRQWRKRPIQTLKSQSFKAFIKQIRAKKYDLIIDAQGLLKSAWITKIAKGKRVGFDYKTARESLASIFYHQTYATDWEQHAVVRMRNLFADALGYTYEAESVDYGICTSKLTQPAYPKYMVFLHGTTWLTKHWPEQYWITLADKFTDLGYKILLPWGNEEELERAERIAENKPHVEVLPKLDLVTLAGILAHASLVYAVDTGLGHMAAALHVPTVSLFGATDPKLTGTYGQHQVHLSAEFPCAPCFQRTCSHPAYE